jgi:hypothetical protein
LYGADSGGYTLTTFLIDKGSIKSNVQTGEISKGELCEYTVKALGTALNVQKGESRPMTGFELPIEVIIGIIVAIIIAVVAVAAVKTRKGKVTDELVI